jgi:hypothetical protein
LGQANQDKFVLNVLKEKRNGYFLEIGSNHPITPTEKKNETKCSYDLYIL